MVETKLFVPSVRPEWVGRPELDRYLMGDRRALVLVDAPAGFGKTTLVAQWCARLAHRRRFAWVSLDRDDDEPGQLWGDVIAALRRVCPQIRAVTGLRELRQRAPDVTGTVIPALINELARPPAPVVLALDDYHVIKNRACHDQVMFLLAHLPPSAQLVLITRADPPWPLARLRAARMMAEVRQHDLRFTGAQAAALVSAVSGARLSDSDAAALVERTEGWPAAVYLAALSLRGHRSPSAFVRRFGGDNRFIVDFLAEEVLSRQPAGVRRFLAQTSILDRFCAPLCDAVTGAGDAAEQIELLERENLFLEPLDDTRQWYRYHRLFAQLLRSQAARTEPVGVAALHRRASGWHQRHGMVAEAIHHALAAGDTDVAAGLITRHWPELAEARPAARVRGWLRALGDDHIAKRPVLAHCAAWAAALSGDPAAARRWLPVIEEGHHHGRLPDGMHSLQFSAALLHGIFGFGGPEVMRQAAARAVELETDPASPWYAMARAAFGFSRYVCGDPEAAWGPLEQAARGRAAKPILGTFALSVLSLVAVELGRPSLAGELVRAARGPLPDDVVGQPPFTALARVATGAVYAAQHRLDDARTEAVTALESLSRAPGCDPWVVFEAALLLARVYLEQGERDDAAQLASEAGAVLDAMPGGTQALRARLGELERRVAAPPPVPAAELTDRERSVLRLLRGTLSLREIGQEMSVSQNTVKSHAKAIYRKLGVTTRREAVARSGELRLL